MPRPKFRAGRRSRSRPASYEGLRKERTATVQQMSRDNIQFFHHADIPNLEERMSRHREAHLWLYSFDVTQQDFISRGS